MERPRSHRPDWDSEQVAQVVGLLATKWTLPVVAALWDGPLRRNALRHNLDPVTDKVLTETLRRLEDHGVVVRRLLDRTPPQVEYALTRRGRALHSALQAMTEWAEVSEPNP